MRQVLLTLAAVGLATAVRPALAGDDAPRPAEGRHAFLGLEIEALTPALATQLSGVIPSGQGVLVTHVPRDSPAAKAGVQAYDVLFRYDGRNVASPAALIELVRGDTPRREVTIELVRAGKVDTRKVILGERGAPAERPRPRVFRVHPDERLREFFEESETTGEGPAWGSFDSLRLTRLEGRRWRAEIDFRSKEGQKVHKSFEGTRAELRKDIQAEPDLPANERAHLLRALNLHEPVFELHFPPFGPLTPGDVFQP